MACSSRDRLSRNCCVTAEPSCEPQFGEKVNTCEVTANAASFPAEAGWQTGADSGPSATFVWPAEDRCDSYGFNYEAGVYEAKCYREYVLDVESTVTFRVSGGVNVHDSAHPDFFTPPRNSEFLSAEVSSFGVVKAAISHTTERLGTYGEAGDNACLVREQEDESVDVLQPGAQCVTFTSRLSTNGSPHIGEAVHSFEVLISENAP